MRAVIVTGRLVQDHEFIYPFYRLQEDGYHVDVAVRGKAPCQGIIGVKIEPTIDIPDLVVADYDLLVIPGGVKAMEHMRLDRGLLRFIEEFHDAGKVVAAICSGTQMLISAKLVAGRRVSGYYAIKDDIENAGGKFVDEPAVVCQRLVTSPHYKYLGEWMAAVLTVVEGNISDRRWMAKREQVLNQFYGVGTAP